MKLLKCGHQQPSPGQIFEIGWLYFLSLRRAQCSTSLLQTRVVSVYFLSTVKSVIWKECEIHPEGKNLQCYPSRHLPFNRSLAFKVQIGTFKKEISILSQSFSNVFLFMYSIPFSISLRFQKVSPVAPSSDRFLVPVTMQQPSFVMSTSVCPFPVQGTLLSSSSLLVLTMIWAGDLLPRKSFILMLHIFQTLPWSSVVFKTLNNFTAQPLTCHKEY